MGKITRKDATDLIDKGIITEKDLKEMEDQNLVSKRGKTTKRYMKSDGQHEKDVALLKVARSDNTVRMSSFCSAYKWDGQAKYQTDSRAGH